MPSGLSETYQSILLAYLGGAVEEASLQAYDFARQCLRDGLAPDDVVALHLEVIGSADVAEKYAHAADRAQGLLLDVVMAFSLSYQQAIGKLEEANSELERLSRFKSQMLSMVAHDMMNHLVATKMTLTMLQREHAESKMAGDLGNLLEIVADQEHLVQNLLDLGRIESGRISLDVENIDLTRLIRRSVAKLQRSSPRHYIRLEGPDVVVRGDRGKLQQIIDNLLSNALKYSPDGGPVDIVVVAEEKQVRISFRDEGLGIRAEDVPHLFEPFYRGRTHRSDIRGTGLGLAIVQALVKMHDGTLDVESQLGHGSTFCLTLPLVRALAEARA